LHDLREKAPLVGREILLLGLSVHEQHEEDLALIVPVVDDAQAATFSTAFLSPS
jgi:hypothetical protein